MATRGNPVGIPPSESVKLEDDQGALIDTGNPLPVADAALAELFGNLTFTLDVGDVQIGAVELKDATTSNRAAIDASGRLSVDGSGVTQPVSAASLPLPSGAATAANQATALSSLGSIASNTTGAATGARQDTGNAALAAIQAAVEGTVDVAVIGSVSVSGSVAVSNFPATQSVTQSGAWSVSFTAPQHVIIDSSASIAVTGPLTDSQLRAAPVPVSGTFYQATQPVSAASLPLPEGAATGAKQDTGNVSLASIDGKIPAPEGGRIPVVLPAGGSGLTDSELRAAAVDVSAPSLEIAQGTASADLVGPMVQGIVSDAPTNPLNDVTAPLSLTKQGRLRVAAVVEDVGVSFTSADEAKMWGELRPDYSHTGSPWAGW